MGNIKLNGISEQSNLTSLDAELPINCYVVASSDGSDPGMTHGRSKSIAFCSLAKFLP